MPGTISLARLSGYTVHAVSQASTDPRLRIWFNQSWGPMRTEARSYARKDGPVVAGVDERANYPLFGFQLKEDSYRIAEWRADGVRFYPPPMASLERAVGAASFQPVPSDELSAGYLDVATGTRLRLREADSELTVTVDLLKERAGWDKKKAAFYLVFLMAAALGAPLAFLLAGPDPTLVTRAMEDSRVKRGLPAQPEPLDLEAMQAEDPEGARRAADGTIVLPASVR